MVVVLGGRVRVLRLRRVVVLLVMVLRSERRHGHVWRPVVGMHGMEALEIQLQVLARTAALAAARRIRV